jgi:hypothetical protein
MSIKYVIVEQTWRGREVAVRNISFATREEAEAYIPKHYGRYGHRYHVESRKVKDIDATQEMHCQCCNRPIHAALGTIAHHGYTRPGYGWQTASCFGAKRLPWEVDREAVMDLIVHLEGLLKSNLEARADVAAEKQSVVRQYSGEYDKRIGRSPTRSVEFTRETFEQVVKDTPLFARRHSGSELTFDYQLALDLRERDFRITRLRQDIKEFTARYRGWTQTHKWADGKWAALETEEVK